MSNDMKLIMESWRANVIQESEGAKVADEILKDLEGKLNEELFTVAGMIIAFLIKMATLSAMLSAIAKFGSFVQERISGSPSALLDNIASFTEEASKRLATLGIPDGFAKLMQSRIVKNYLGEDEAAKWSTWFKQVEKVVAFLVLLTAAGYEIWTGIQQSGGSVQMIKDLAQKSGIKDGKSLEALGNLFDRIIDSGEISAISVKARNIQGRRAIWSSIVRNLRELIPQVPAGG